MPLDIINFLTPSRLFSLKPAIDITTVYFLGAIFGAFVVAAIVIKLISKIKKNSGLSAKLANKYFSVFLTMGLIGWLLVWFRFERVYVLSARFMLLLWLISLVVWLFFIFKFQFRIMPKIISQSQKQKEFNKYLPKKK